MPKLNKHEYELRLCCRGDNLKTEISEKGVLGASYGGVSCRWEKQSRHQFVGAMSSVAAYLYRVVWSV